MILIDESLKNNSHNEMNKLVLRLKIPKDKIFQTSQDCKEHDSSILKRRRLAKVKLN